MQNINSNRLKNDGTRRQEGNVASVVHDARNRKRRGWLHSRDARRVVVYSKCLCIKCVAHKVSTESLLSSHRHSVKWQTFISQRLCGGAVRECGMHNGMRLFRPFHASRAHWRAEREIFAKRQTNGMHNSGKILQKLSSLPHAILCIVLINTDDSLGLNEISTRFRWLLLLFLVLRVFVVVAIVCMHKNCSVLSYFSSHPVQICMQYGALVPRPTHFSFPLSDSAPSKFPTQAVRLLLST